MVVLDWYALIISMITVDIFWHDKSRQKPIQIFGEAQVPPCVGVGDEDSCKDNKCTDVQAEMYTALLQSSLS